MGTPAPVIGGETLIIIIMIKQFIIAVVLIQAALSEPLDKFPHPYVAHPKVSHEPVHHLAEHHADHHLVEHHADHHEEHKLLRKCHTEYVSVVSKECHTVYEKECRTDTKHKYKTEFSEECQELPRKKCLPTTREVEDQECSAVYEEKCSKETKHSYDIDFQTSCQPVQKRICHASVGYGYIKSGRSRRASPVHHRILSHHGGYEPRCEEVTKEVCEKVPVKTAKYVDVPVCVSVPNYTCHDVKREVPHTQCHDETYQKCYKVPNQVILEVPLETCSDVPHEVCEDVTKQVPSTTCQDYKH